MIFILCDFLALFGLKICKRGHACPACGFSGIINNTDNLYFVQEKNQMSEQKRLTFQEQKILKLKIEDEIPKFLDSKMKQSALDFIAYMRANKMQPSWLSTNSWKANYKGQNVCAIRLSKGSWCVVPRISRWNKLISSYNLYEKELKEKGLQDIVFANINFCRSCANCGPGWGMTFFDKNFENVCHNVPVRYIDPGEAEIDFIKKILDLMKQTIADNKV